MLIPKRDAVIAQDARPVGRQARSDGEQSEEFADTQRKQFHGSTRCVSSQRRTQRRGQNMV